MGCPDERVPDMERFFRNALFLFLMLPVSLVMGAKDSSENPPFLFDGKDNGIPIAVIDTGIDYNHAMLGPGVWRNANEDAGLDGKDADLDRNGYIADVHGWDYQDNDNRPYDYIKPKQLVRRPVCSVFDRDPSNAMRCFGDYARFGTGLFVDLLLPGSAGHGTHVSGIALRKSGGNGAIVPLRVDFTNPDRFKAIMMAVKYAAKMKIRIVNMSFGANPEKLGSGEQAFIQKLKELMLRHREILFVVSAGNENVDITNEPVKPAPASFRIPNSIVVGATDQNGELAVFSNTGAGHVDVYAPGVDIESAWPGGRTKLASGTSMSAPFVAGVAAGLLNVDPQMSTQKLKELVLGAASGRELLFIKHFATRDGFPAGTKYKFNARVMTGG